MTTTTDIGIVAHLQDTRLRWQKATAGELWDMCKVEHNQVMKYGDRGELRAARVHQLLSRLFYRLAVDAGARK